MSAKRRLSVKALRTKHAEEMNVRARARRHLAMQMGMFMLNELENAGCFSIRDYTRIRPKSVINAWNSEFGARRLR